ncbi:MAG TPA: hypothetical protein VHG08_28710 [Longimicrobium sp.]|nr:hypothetical protein [Longimicrobium sp.]
MSVESFLSTTEGVLTALTGLVAALIALVKLIHEVRGPAAEAAVEVPGQASPPAPRPHRRREWPFFAGIVVLQTFVILTSASIGRYAYSARPSAVEASLPEVEITTPLPGQPVELRLSPEGSGAFSVSGSSSGVADDLDRRVYVLIHPEDPWAAGWWVQSQATVDPRSGEWTSRNWFGDRKFTPAPGHRLQLVAVVTRPHAVTFVNDPKDLRPVAQSRVVPITVGATRPE